MGGAEHSLLDMLTYMAPKAECHLVTVEPGTLVEAASQAGVICHVVPCAMKARGFLRKNIVRTILTSLPEIVSFCKYVVLLRILIYRIKPQLIHANVPKSHIALFLLQKTGYRNASVFHIREIFGKGSLPWKAYKILFSKKNSFVLAISNRVFEMLPPTMQQVGEVVYNGVLIPPKQQRPKYGTSPFKLCYVGRIVPWKGCDLLITVAAFLKKQSKNSHIVLTLVGDTSYWPLSYRDELNAMIRSNNLEKNCFIYPNTNDVASVYASHDVFVNASLQEPFGRSIAEAQGAALPVVSFDSGAVSEIVEQGKTGFLIPYGDCGAMGEKILMLRNDPKLCKTLGENGRERALRLFNRDIQIPLLCKSMIGRAEQC